MTYDPWERTRVADGNAPAATARRPAVPEPGAGAPQPSPPRRRGIAAGGLIALKLIGNLAFVFKFKFLLSFVISAALYAWVWGWQFGVGFILLLMVHELGHVIQLRREGIEASAPMFVPFLGAFVAMKELPDNAWTEAKVGLAGPVLGSVGALAVLVWAEQVDSNLLRALAYVGFLLNLSTSCRRAVRRRSRRRGAPPRVLVRRAVHGRLFFFAYHNLFALLVLGLGGYELYRRWNHRNEPRSGVPPRDLAATDGRRHGLPRTHSRACVRHARGIRHAAVVTT